MPKGMPDKHAEGKVAMPKAGVSPHAYGGMVPDPMSTHNRLIGSTPPGPGRSSHTQGKSDGKFAGPGKGANGGSMGGTPVGGASKGSRMGKKASKGPHNY